MKKLLFLLCGLMLVVGCTTAQPEPTSTALPPTKPPPTPLPEPTEVFVPIIETEVIDVNWYMDSNYKLHFIGLIKNTGNVDLEFVKVDAVFRTPGELVGDESGYTSLRVLPVGQLSPFSLTVKADPTVWTQYKLQVEAKRASVYNPYTNFDVLSADGIIPADGAYEIVGEIKNTGEHNSKSVDVIGVLFDQDGHIIGTETAHPDDARLAAGLSSPFKLMFLQIAEGEVASFEILVFAEER
jgi:hypothetical protein